MINVNNTHDINNHNSSTNNRALSHNNDNNYSTKITRLILVIVTRTTVGTGRCLGSGALSAINNTTSTNINNHSNNNKNSNKSDNNSDDNDDDNNDESFHLKS